MDDFEKQKFRSEIFKNYLSSIAIVIGGIWVLYNFHVLRSAYTTHLDIATKESKLLALDLDIQVSVLDSPCELSTGLEVLVLIENKGDYPVKLNLVDGKTGFGVSKIEQGYDENGHPKVSEFYPSVPYSFYFAGVWAEQTEVVALPGIKTALTYFVTVEQGGYYLASFFSEISSEPLELITKHTKGEGSDSPPNINVWTAQKYFSMPEQGLTNQCIQARPEQG